MFTPPTTISRARRETRTAWATRMFATWRTQGLPAALPREDAADLLAVQGAGAATLPEGETVPLALVARLASRVDV